MTGLGTIVNVCGIVVGGLIGLGCGRLLTKRLQDTLMMAAAVAVIFIGIGSTLRQMLHLTPDGLEATGTMMMIASLSGGALIGEFINLEDRLASFGEWLKKKSGSGGDSSFVEGFVTASLTVCIGAMAVIGSITDSLQGDHAILFAKTVLDLIIVMIMTATLGRGCIFSAISVGIFQGSITLFARLIAPWMTEPALANLSYVGNILIFCVGINLLFGYRIRVANLLPSLIIAIFWPV